MKNFVEGAVYHSQASGICYVDTAVVACVGEDGRKKREWRVFVERKTRIANKEVKNQYFLMPLEMKGELKYIDFKLAK